MQNLTPTEVKPLLLNTNSPHWISAIQPLFLEVQAAGHQALALLRGDNPDRSLKSTKSCLTDYFNRSLADLIPIAATVPSSGGDDWVVFRDIATVRVKASDRKLNVRNIRTQRWRQFIENEELPGISASLPRLELCYVFDPRRQDFSRLCFTQRDADGILASIDVPWGAVEQSAIVRLEFDLPETKVSAKRDLVRRRREIKDA